MTQLRIRAHRGIFISSDASEGGGLSMRGGVRFNTTQNGPFAVQGGGAVYRYGTYAVFPFTIEFWHKPTYLFDEDGPTRQLMGSRGLQIDSGFFHQWEEGFSVGLRKVGISGGAAWSAWNIGKRSPSGGYHMSVDQWTHMAVSYEASYIRLFVNGEYVGDQGYADPSQASFSGYPTKELYGTCGEFYIGALNDLEANGVTSFMKGYLSDVRIWHTMRTPTEIAENMNYRLTGNEPYLAAYWKLNEESGTGILDYSGNGYHGTLISGEWYTDTTLPIGGGDSVLHVRQGEDDYAVTPYQHVFTIQAT